MMGIVLSLLESPVISLPLQLGVTRSELRVQFGEERLVSCERKKHVLARQSLSAVSLICCNRQNANEITNTTTSSISATTNTATELDKTRGRQVGSCEVELNKLKQVVQHQIDQQEKHMSREEALLLLNDDDDYDYDCEQSASVVNRPMKEVNELTTSGKPKVECSEKVDKRVQINALLNGNCSDVKSRSSGGSSLSVSRRASDQAHALCSEIALNSRDESVLNITTQNTGKKAKQTLRQQQRQQREQKNKEATAADADILNEQAAAKNKTITKLKSTNNNKISLAISSSSIHKSSPNSSNNKNNINNHSNNINLSDIDENVPYAKHAHYLQPNNKATNHLLEKKTNHQQQQVQQHSTSIQKSLIGNTKSNRLSHNLSNNSSLDIMRKPNVKKCALNRVVIEHEALVKQQVHSAHFIDQQSQLLLTTQYHRQKYQHLNTDSPNNINNRQYKYQQVQLHRKQKHQHQSAQNHNQPLANLDKDASSQLKTNNTPQFVPTKKFKQNRQFNTNNTSTSKNHLAENGQRTRDRRSLSTTSSLASSASSSPSSSMLQIYMRDRINNNINANYTDRIIAKCPPQITAKLVNNKSHHQRQQPSQHQQQQSRRNRNEFRDRKQLISSSASSTISSSSSSCDSAQLSPNLIEPEDIVSNLLLHSTANLSIHQQTQPPPPNIHSAHIQSEFNNNISNDNYNFQQAYQINTANRNAQIFTFRDSPPERPWLQCQPNNQLMIDNKSIRQQKVYNLSRQLEQEFTVLSYNVLCDRLVNKKAFPTSPDVALDWFYRRKLIMKQLREFDADIIALQELEIEHYETYFMVELEKHGNYKSIFEPKSRAKTMNFEQQKRVDGCAIFYKKNKFKLVERHLLEYSRIAMANSRGSEAMLNRVMTKDNIGLVAVLELINDDDQQTLPDDMIDNSDVVDTREEQQNQQPQQLQRQPETFSLTGNQTIIDSLRLQKRRQIVVCNTHIHWDPECCDVKLVQTILLMNELESIAKHHGFRLGQQQILREESFLNNSYSKQQTGGDGQKLINNNDDEMLPLILLGDFNSLPDSGVTEFLIEGQISSLHEDFRDHKYSSCSTSLAIPNVYTDGCAESSTVLNYNHPFNLASAYKKDIMPYTNYTAQFKAIIDYIFYSQNSIQLMGVLGAFDRNWFKENRIKGLPHINFPSDHLPLLVKFKLSAIINHEFKRS